ncbi:IS3 family transposase [Anaerobacillus sp. HL2]|nr:IS3 family transposase [Anaerobacillus sp. HL2]
MNAFSHSWKSERQNLKTVATVDEAKEIVHEYIRYYNHTRIQKGSISDPHNYAKAC